MKVRGQRSKVRGQRSKVRGALIAALAAAAFACGFGSARAEERPYTVATLPTWKNWGHNVQWNYIYKEAGWAYTNLQQTVEDMEWLKANLDKIDMLIGTQLFNYETPDCKLPFDMHKYAKPIGDWIEKGGCLYMMDCNYHGAPFEWFKTMDPALEVNAPEKPNHCNGFGPAVGVEPIDPIFFFPNQAEYGFAWNHMTVPDQKTTKWKILSRCQHGEPTMMICRKGKGIMLLNQRAAYNREFLQNLKANQIFSSKGLTITSAHSPIPTAGPNRYEVHCINRSGRDFTGKLTLRLTEVLEEDTRKGRATKLGQVTEYSGESVIANGKDGAFTLDCIVKVRGRLRAELILEVDGASGTCFDKLVTVPEFFTLLGTRYRNLLSVSRRFDDISFRTALWPDDDGSRKDFSVKIAVKDAKGREVSSTKGEPLARGESAVTVRIPRTLAVGEYVAVAKLSEGGKEIATAESPFQIMPDSPGGAFYDEDATLLVEGKPYLPLGIYHVGRNNNGEWAKVADVGFNVFNLFSYMGTGSANPLRELDVKLLWEQLPHRAPGACHAQGDELRGNPASLLWYTVDEPAEAQFPFVKSLDDAWHETDKEHPTFIVSYQPHHFPRNAKLSDILAPDNYPYGGREKAEQEGLASISRTADRALAATGGIGPMIFVPQAFGHEPPDIWRNMSFQALCHGAKGLIWYAWREDEHTGLKYHPDLIAEVAETVGELKALAPAILNAKPARRFTAEDYNLHGLVMSDPDGKYVALMLVNSSGKEMTCDLALPELDKSLTAVPGAWRYPSLACADGVLKVSLPGLGSGIWVLSGEVPAPVLQTAASAVDLAVRGTGRTLKVAPEASEGGLFSAKVYGSIQEAVDAAKDGDVIEVAEGTYGPVRVANKVIDIVAKGRCEATVIDAEGMGRALTLTARPFGDMGGERNVRVVGFTVRGGDSTKDAFRPDFGGGALGGTLENCVFEKCTADYGGGAAYASLTGCLLSGNTAKKDGGAAALCDLTFCRAVKNSADFDGGAAHFCNATRCRFADNAAGRDGGATHFGANTSCVVFRNKAAGNGGGSVRTRNESVYFGNNTCGAEGGAVFGGISTMCTMQGNVAGGLGGAAAQSPYGGWGMQAEVSRSVLTGNVSKKDPAAALFHVIGGSDNRTDATNAVRGVRNGDLGLLNAKEPFPGPKSDLVDAGAAGYRRGAVDAFGMPRVGGGAADLGACERPGANVLLAKFDFSVARRPSAICDANPFFDDSEADCAAVFARVQDGAFVFDGQANAERKIAGALSPKLLPRALAKGAAYPLRTVTLDFSCAKGEGGQLFGFAGRNPLDVSVDRTNGVLTVSYPVGDQKKAANLLSFDCGKVADGKRHTLVLSVDAMCGLGEGGLGVSLDGEKIAPATLPGNPRELVGFDLGAVIGGKNEGNLFVGKLHGFEYRGAQN